MDNKELVKCLDVLEKDNKYVLIPSKVGYTIVCWSKTSVESKFREKNRPKDKKSVFLVNYKLLKKLAVLPKKYIPLIEEVNNDRLLCSFILKRRKNKLFNLMPKYTSQMSINPSDETSSFAINAGLYTEEIVKQALKRSMILVCSSANKSGVGNEGVFKKIPKNIVKNSGYNIIDDGYVLKTYSPKNRDRGPIIRLANNKIEIIRDGLMMDKIKKIIKKYEKI